VATVNYPEPPPPWRSRGRAMLAN